MGGRGRTGGRWGVGRVRRRTHLTPTWKVRSPARVALFGSRSHKWSSIMQCGLRGGITDRSSMCTDDLLACYAPPSPSLSCWVPWDRCFRPHPLVRAPSSSWARPWSHRQEMGGQEERGAGCIPSLLPPRLVAILVWLDPLKPRLLERRSGVASCFGCSPLPATPGIVPSFTLSVLVAHW